MTPRTVPASHGGTAATAAAGGPDDPLWARFAAGPDQIRPLIAGTAPWSGFGVRDPMLLTEPDGAPVLTDGQATVYFNGRDRAIPEGGITRVGRARMSVCRPLPADGAGVDVDADFVFEDGDYAAAGSVLRLRPDLYWMFYSFGTKLGFRRALSTDGRHWQAEPAVLLTPGQFGCKAIGLPFVLQQDGQWLMLFEGFRDRTYAIHAAVSDDGQHWAPRQGQMPVMTPADDAWDGASQANPSLGRLGNELVLFYNGYSRAETGGWDIGLARPADPASQGWQPGAAPILTRRPEPGWRAGRVEGARLLQADERQALLLFFGLPGRNSYQGGTIGLAHFGKADSTAEDAPANDAFAQTPEIAAATVRYNDKLAESYFEIWDTRPIQRYTQTVEQRWMTELVARGDRVLLAGSGGGREIAALLGLAGEVVALDISPEMLRIGRARFGEAAVTWRLGDLHDPPPDLGLFDHIFALGGVYAYLPEPARASRAMAGCLRPGGCLSVCVMNADHPTESAAPVVMKDGRVRQGLNRARLEAMMTRAGLTVTRVEGLRYLVDLLPPSWNRLVGSAEDLDSLERALALEAELQGRLPVERGKFLWMTGRRPG